MKRAHRLWLLLPMLMLTGCLLPQPDTPIIPPVAPGPMAAPAQGATGANRKSEPVVPPDQGLTAPEAGTAMAAPAEQGALEGTITGVAAVQVVAESAGEGPRVEAPVEEGAFRHRLAPGTYKLDLVTADGRTLRLEGAIAVEPGVTRRITIEVEGDSATISEDVKVEEVASPEASASP